MIRPGPQTCQLRAWKSVWCHWWFWQAVLVIHIVKWTDWYAAVLLLETHGPLYCPS